MQRLASVTMLKLYHIWLLLVVVFFHCASSQNIEQHTSLPIYNLVESLFTHETLFNNHFNDCSTNFKALERALYLTDNNRYALISAFYPARESSSLFVNVRYEFSSPENDQTELTVCHNWLWTTGTFYLIQSPDVFLFTSLLFVHPENKVRTLKLTLPAECAELAYTCASNPNNISMLEILTKRLKLYAQYNSLDQISVSDADAYAVKAVPVLDIKTIYDQSVNTYFSFCIVFPIPIIIMLTVVCFKGARLQLRVKLNNPHNFPSFAALATMGMLFSFFVVSLDICALVWAFYPHIGKQENELLQSGFNSTIESHRITIGTLIIDAVTTLFSCIMFAAGLVVECGHFCCKQECDKCLSCCFRFWLSPIFCCSKLEQSRSKEKMNWILAATSIAPVVCFGSHIVFVVLAWLADPKHAGAVSVIYIFMFFYYYVTLKAFYQLLIDGKTGCLTCCGDKVPKNTCCSCCCSCLLKFKPQHEPLYELTSLLESPEKEIENREEVFPDAHISFWAIFLTGIFGMLLASLQVYSITSLVLLPLIGVIQDTPNYILSLFQVAVFLLTAVITYIVLTAEEPVERELVKSMVRNFDYYYKKFKAQRTEERQLQAEGQSPTEERQSPAEDEPLLPDEPDVPGADRDTPAAERPHAEAAPEKPSRADVVQKVGNIIGALAFKELNPRVIIEMDACKSDDDLLYPLK